MYLIIAEFSDFRLCFYWTACSSQGQRTICQFVNLCDILPSSPQFFETDTDTIKKWKSFETEMSHSGGSVVNTVWSTHTMKSWPNIGTTDFFCQNLVWFEIYYLLFTMVLLHSIRASCAFVHLYLYMCMCIRICLPCLVSMQGKRFNL